MLNNGSLRCRERIVDNEKNMLLFILLLALSFVLTACGNNSPSADDETKTVTKSLQTEEPMEDVSKEDAETEANGGNVLNAYFFHTGYTEEVAQMIGEYTGGILDEIQWAEEYGDLQEKSEEELTINNLNNIEPWIQGLGLME